MAPTKPYSGNLRRLLLAFDVGTTYSGIAYAILDPGEVPKIQAVTRYPGQENGDFKIPTILYYTLDGEVHAAGAEAASPSMRLEAEDLNLVYVEWFKLHLRPRFLIDDAQREVLPDLPPRKTVVDVFGDFLAYLFSCARRFITQTHANGESIWQSVDSRIEFILGHPNGWEGSQQSKMRQAAIAGGLIPDTPAGHSRVHFVTEGEASLHYCLDCGLASDAIKDGSSVMIIDAGGGTVDLSTYSFTGTSPISVEEIATPDCILQGSTRVNVRARQFFKQKLRNSQYGNEDDIDSMVEHFDRSTKPTFKDSEERSYVKFGSIRDRDPAVGIRGGQLQLTGHEVESLFEPSVVAIIEAVQKQRGAAASEVALAFLVGGFAASPWLFRKLKASLQDSAIQLSRPDHHTSKAVAAGAASFFLDQFVTRRVAKFTYGVELFRYYDELNPEHWLRRNQTITMPSGKKLIPGGFSVALAKGSQMSENQEAFIDVYIEGSNPNECNEITCDVTCYRGNSEVPRWTDLERGMFSCLCTVSGDTSAVQKPAHVGPLGLYYGQCFKFIILCGTTEMRAQLSWIENGVEKRGPAQIVYDDNTQVV